MCGIAGWLGRVPDGGEVGERVLKRLRHRGPDASARRCWPEATLLFTRLAILDLSPAGGQPMSNEEGTAWSVFNGEIYNHRELRQRLEARGHRFRGSSDGEVLPHLYEEAGVDFVRSLRGMFALALYDTRERKLLLARDRFGIKPIFYTPGAERLAFASEINALRAVPGVDLTPDPQAVHDYGALFYIPAPETFYRGIRALEPGETLEARFEGDAVQWKTRPFHHWTICPELSLTRREAAERAEPLITAAVERQLQSDVPLGTLLSGGIDSSLVSAAAQRRMSSELHTFSVRFAEADYDETPAAMAVAKHIGSRHTSLGLLREEGNWETVTGLLRHAGQPFADCSLFAVHAICRRMRYHVTVALSGDGGDEAFGGYNQYWQLSAIDRLQRIPAGFWRAAAGGVSLLARMGLVRSSMPRRVRDLTGADSTSVVQVLSSWLRPEEHASLSRVASAAPVRRLFERKWEHGKACRASREEALSALATEVGFRLTLSSDLLFKVDTASMRESLEVRVPLLDEDLVDFGLRLPHRLKVAGRKGKRVLRDVAARWLPAGVVGRRKQGFSLPMDTWVDARFKSAFRETVLAPSSRLPEFFRPEVYRPWVDAFCLGTEAPEVSREGLWERSIMLLSVALALEPSQG